MTMRYDAPAKDIIRVVRGLLAEPAHWVKGTNMRVFNGVRSMCLAYAILVATGTQADERGSDIALQNVAIALGFSGSGPMVTFNDMSLTTHAKLLERLDRALENEPTVN